jgi:hypothetical protein
LKRLASSDDVTECFAREYLTFALSRPLVPGDTCSLDAVSKRFTASGDLRRLVGDIVASPTFVHRLSGGAP